MNGSVPWPTMRANSRGTGHNIGTALVAKKSFAPAISRLKTQSSIVATPVIAANDCIYVGALDGKFYAWDPLRQCVTWTFAETVDGAAYINAAGQLFVSTTSGRLYCLNNSGMISWCWDNQSQATRKMYSPSTIYWFEANVIQGPSGLVYAACDDFYLYAVSAQTGELVWAFPTGFNVWSVPAFGLTDSLYFGSFDTRFYALESMTGELRWSLSCDNLIVSSAAVSQKSEVYFGTLGGTMYALIDEGARCITKWRVLTGGAIYASPTLAPDEETLYFGSMDGWCYALATQDGGIRWRRFLGGPIVSSAALGPDPDEEFEYLILMATRAGGLLALTPTGEVRWRFDPNASQKQRVERLAGFTSSWAVGRHGLSIASSDGELLHLSHSFYCSEATSGLQVRPPDRWLDQLVDGSRLYRVHPNGRMDDVPLPRMESNSLEVCEQIGAFEVLSFRGLSAHSLRDAQFARLDVDSLRVEIEPAVNFRAFISADRSLVHVVPSPTPDQVRAQAGHVRRICIEVRAETLEPSQKHITACFAARLAKLPSVDIRPALARGWSLRGFAFHDPAIINPFDEFGIASIEIQLCVISMGDSDGKFVAWGTEILIEGIPKPRRLFTVFQGSCVGGEIILSAKNCEFEITAAAVPLDELRLSAVYVPESIGDNQFRNRSTEPTSATDDQPAAWPNESFTVLASYQFRLTCKIVRSALLSLLAFWPPWQPSQWGNWWRIKCRAFGMLLRFLLGRLHRPWQLLDPLSGAFNAVGTFRAFPVMASAKEVRFKRLDKSRWWRGRLRAELVAPAGEHGLDMGILLVNAETGSPIEMDYTGNTRCWSTSNGEYVLELAGVRTGRQTVSAYIIARNLLLTGPLPI